MCREILVFFNTSNITKHIYQVRALKCLAKVHSIGWVGKLTLYLICQFRALPVQQQIKDMSKIWTNGVQLFD